MDKNIENALESCKSLSSLAKILFGKENSTNRYKVKKILLNEGINWEEWLKEKNKKPIRYCLNCGKELNGDYRSKFCNHSCSASYNNRGIVRNGKKIERETNCLYCGKELINSQTKFCCATCNIKYNYEENIRKWKEGEINGGNKNGCPKVFLRKYFLLKNDCKCEKCGFNTPNPYTGLSILQIHHKDGDCFNNKEENLELLCPNCHGLTENFGSRNLNSTRVDRRTKYFKEQNEKKE